MKLGLFSDPHYCKAELLGKNRRPKRSLERMREAMEVFRAEGVDACICLGDFTDCAPGDTKEAVLSNFSEALALVRSYEIDFTLIPGNHDYLMLTGEDLLRFGLRLPPYVIETPRHSILVLDANYRASGKRFDEAGELWTDCNLPPKQLAFLQDALERSSKECIVMLHENLDPFVEARHIVKNADAVRTILQKSGKAKLVLQGHYHKGALHELEGILYKTLPAMCEGEENTYQILEC